MGSFANTLFTVLLGWFRGIVSSVWAAFTSEKGGGLLQWIGSHWILVAAVLCIIGLTADFAVYLFRWKPLHVWKSFFERRKTGNLPMESDSSDYPEDDPDQQSPGEYNRLFRTDAYQAFPDNPAPRPEPHRPVEAAVSQRNDAVPVDFSRWLPEDHAENEDQLKKQEEDSAFITPAGHYVPADSPYRRPAVQKSAETDNRTTVYDPDLSAADTGRDGSIRAQGEPDIRPRRRRRLRVGDFFSDPEEDLQQFDAPQHLIDQHQAYHEPVYPRGWKKNEGNGE